MSKKPNHKYCFGKNCDERRHIINAVVMVTGILGPLASVPQAWQIYSTCSAAGVALLTWVLFLIYNSTMIIYAIVHRLLPILISNIVWIILEVIIITGILIYS